VNIPFNGRGASGLLVGAVALAAVLVSCSDDKAEQRIRVELEAARKQIEALKQEVEAAKADPASGARMTTEPVRNRGSSEGQSLTTVAAHKTKLKQDSIDLELILTAEQDALEDARERKKKDEQAIRDLEVRRREIPRTGTNDELADLSDKVQVAEMNLIRTKMDAEGGSVATEEKCELRISTLRAQITALKKQLIGLGD
jgi:hypothetical protein